MVARYGCPNTPEATTPQIHKLEAFASPSSSQIYVLAFGGNPASVSEGQVSTMVTGTPSSEHKCKGATSSERYLPSSRQAHDNTPAVPSHLWCFWAFMTVFPIRLNGGRGWKVSFHFE